MRTEKWKEEKEFKHGGVFLKGVDVSKWKVNERGLCVMGVIWLFRFFFMRRFMNKLYNEPRKVYTFTYTRRIYFLLRN